MSLEEKLSARLEELDLPPEREQTAGDLVQALCEELERTETTAESVEEALREVVKPSLVQARDTVTKAEEMAS